MSVHVVTARIYTGAVYGLGVEVSSGLLGGWYPKAVGAEKFSTPAAAERVYEALLTYLCQPAYGRSMFDPRVLVSLYERARVVEFGVAEFADNKFAYIRHRALQLNPAPERFRNTQPCRIVAA